MQHFLNFEIVHNSEKYFVTSEHPLQFHILISSQNLEMLVLDIYITLTREDTHCKKGKYSESLLLPIGLSKNTQSNPSDSHLKQKFMSK